MELLISTRRGRKNGEGYEGDIGAGDKQMKRAGDVLCAKCDGAEWGEEERRLMVIVAVDPSGHPALEEIQRKLREARENGEPQPVVSYPFAEYEEIEEERPAPGGGTRTHVRHEMTNRSVHQFNLDRIPPGPQRDPQRKPQEPATAPGEGKRFRPPGQGNGPPDFVTDRKDRRKQRQKPARGRGRKR